MRLDRVVRPLLGTLLGAVVAAGIAVASARASGGGSPASPPTPAPAAPAMAAAPAAPLPSPAAPARTPAATAPPAHQLAGASKDVSHTASRLSNSWGIDISWPQCDANPTGLGAGFATVGVNDGKPFTQNPCLAEQAAYAKTYSGYAAYLNLDAPRSGDPASWGRRAALDGLARARAAGLHPPVLWLDVEVKNHWADPATNVAVIAGAVRALAANGVTAGVYSSQPMWLRITGGADPRMPVWLATTATDYRQLPTWCSSGLGGRPAVLTQYVATTGTQLIDVDVLCANGLPGSVRLFAAGAHA